MEDRRFLSLRANVGEWKSSGICCTLSALKCEVNMRSTVVVLVLIAALIGPVTAQQQGQRELTIEELYLSQDLELQILRGQALSTDREMKQLALRDLRNMIQLGMSNEGVATVLEAMANEGVSRQTRVGNTVTNDFPDIRRQAVELLGQVGGARAHSALVRVLRDEREPMVLAEAAFALGTIGINPNNQTSDFLVSILQRENAASTPDNNLAFAIVLSLETLSKQNGGLAHPEVINVLLETASAPYIRTVRMRAVQAIVNMRDHGG